MNIFVYSDESGVFDNVHNEIFVFGGVVFLGKDEKDNCSRMYSKAEKDIRHSLGIPKGTEVKASILHASDKNSLYRSLNKVFKFGVVVRQKEVHKQIFSCKKDKQRYLDFAYKIAVKRFFQKLIAEGIVDPESVENIYFFIDEHSTATSGCYELKEALERELKTGTFNADWNIFYNPIFPALVSLQLEFCNSEAKILVRAADIVANRIYYLSQNQHDLSEVVNRLYVTKLP